MRAQTRWQLDPDGGIKWEVEQGKAHQDHIEMSGRRVSVIVTYGVDEKGKLILGRQVIFPMLRFAPNKTRDHLALTFGDDATPRVLLNRALPRGEVFGGVFDLSVTRAGDKLKVEVFDGGKLARSHLIRQGETLTVELGRRP